MSSIDNPSKLEPALIISIPYLTKSTLAFFAKKLAASTSSGVVVGLLSIRVSDKIPKALYLRLPLVF